MAIFYENRSDSYYVKMGYNTSFPEHLHKQIEIFYIDSGSMEMTIGSQTRVLDADMISICFPNVSHELKSLSNTSTIPLIFDIEFVSDFSNEFLNFLPSNPFIDIEDAAVLKPLFIELMNCKKEELDSRIAKGLIYQILGSIFSKLELIPSHYEHIDLCQNILGYIQSHFQDEITLSQLSSALGYNKYYISHVLNDKLSISLPDYLNDCRIDYASRLLTHTSYSVTDIAYMSGFSSLRSFYRIFKSKYQMTPNTYRKKASL